MSLYVSLPPELVHRAREHVASGSYGSTREVVHAAWDIILSVQARIQPCVNELRFINRLHFPAQFRFKATSRNISSCHEKRWEATVGMTQTVDTRPPPCLKKGYVTVLAIRVAASDSTTEPSRSGVRYLHACPGPSWSWISETSRTLTIRCTSGH